MEIHKLHEILTREGISHSFAERHLSLVKAGYQIRITNQYGGFISAIEGVGSYGFGGWDHGLFGTDEKDGDLIEVWIERLGSPVGWLTAEEALAMIKEEVEKWSKS